MEAVLGADVGGTAIGAGAVTPDGEVLLATERPAGDPSAVARDPLGAIMAALAETQARARAAGLAVVGCGIGVAGVVEGAGLIATGPTGRAGRIGRDVHNLPELAGCPLGLRVREHTGLPTALDNDVNALALGELRFGVARGLRSFVLLALGTGVGGGIVLNGDVVRGASGHGGELGHVSVDLVGRPCFCGSRGCLKAYVAGPDIAAQAIEGAGDHRGSALAARAGEAPALTALEVFQAAAAGDPLGQAVVDRVCRALGAALGGILNGLNPEGIGLTGGVAPSLAPHLEAIRAWTRAYAFADAYRAAVLSLLPMTKATSVRGAAALFLHEAARGSGVRAAP